MLEIILWTVFGGLLLVAVGLLVDWLANGTCTWCGNGPATIEHYLEAHAGECGGAR